MLINKRGELIPYFTFDKEDHKYGKFWERRWPSTTQEQSVDVSVMPNGTLNFRVYDESEFLTGTISLNRRLARNMAKQINKALDETKR